MSEAEKCDGSAPCSGPIEARPDAEADPLGEPCPRCYGPRLMRDSDRLCRDCRTGRGTIGVLRRNWVLHHHETDGYRPDTRIGKDWPALMDLMRQLFGAREIVEDDWACLWDRLQTDLNDGFDPRMGVGTLPVGLVLEYLRRSIVRPTSNSQACEDEQAARGWDWIEGSRRELTRAWGYDPTYHKAIGRLELKGLIQVRRRGDAIAIRVIDRAHHAEVEKKVYAFRIRGVELPSKSSN